ncbi:DUF6350 family protein [Amycolatopsis sp. NPDC059021]|uniref:cell division protein PerM n=1 Tax=Amycolatopsis sp. NPDC059021 TaxID=3346704 RepID=UPI00367096D3
MELLTRPERPPGDEPVSDPEPDAVTGAKRVRVLLAAALGPLVTGYAVVATLLALVTLTAERATFSAAGALLAAGPGWLAAHQVRLDIGGHPLGVLPLLPTLGVVLLAMRAGTRAARRLGCRSTRRAVPVIAVIAGAHAVFGLIIAVLSLGAPVSANPFTAFVVPGLFGGLSATIGVVRRCGLPGIVRDRLDPLAVRGLRAGALGLAALVLGGALVFALATALSASTVDKLFAPGAGSSFGLFLLSLLYLPNAVVAALSFMTGPGFSIGTASAGIFGSSGGPVPGLPLLGGVPEHHAAWWSVLLVLPALAGGLVGWSVRRIDEDPAARVRTVAIAGALVGFGCVVLGTLAGGRLADGPFDPVSIPVGVASIVAFCWIVIPGGFVTFFAGAHAPARPPAELDEDLPDIDTADTADTDEAADAEESGEDEASEEDGDEADDLDAEEADSDAEEADSDAEEADSDAEEADSDAEEADSDADGANGPFAPPEGPLPDTLEVGDDENGVDGGVARAEIEYDAEYDEEFDAEAEAELGLELPEDIVVDKGLDQPEEEPAPRAEEPGPVTESTEGSGDDTSPGADR